MRKGKLSPWLLSYIRERGDSMNVTGRITLKG